MAVLQVSEAPSRAAYDAVLEALGGARPDGRLLHAAAELPDGRVQIVDVFESGAALDAFGEVIMGAFARAGQLDVMIAAGRPMPYETFDLDRA
jgi:hypothetical protein